MKEGRTLLIIIVVLSCLYIVSILLWFIIKYFQLMNRGKKVDINKLRGVSRNKKLNVLVYQCGYYDPVPPFLEYSRGINKAYCKKWGYDYVYNQPQSNDFPVYWLKVMYLAQHLNNSENKYDLIVYLDDDAIFNDFDISIETFLDSVNKDKKYDIIVSDDPYAFRDVLLSNYTVLNAGCFMFYNTNMSKKFVDDWLKMFRKISKKNKWIMKDDKWTCNKCVWAGDEYEQGCLNTLATTKYKNDVLQISRVLWNGDYIWHLMGEKKKGGIPKLRKKYESI